MKKGASFTLPNLLLVSLLLIGLTSCVPAEIKANIKPIDDYPKQEQLPLTIELRMDEHFRSAYCRTPTGTRVIFGDALVEDAEILARVVYRDVIITTGAASDKIANPSVDAVLRPYVFSMKRTDRPGLWFFPQETTLKLVWELQDRNGELIWRTVVTGVGRGLTRYINASVKTQGKTAIKEAFKLSFEEMASAPEIRRLVNSE